MTAPTVLDVESLSYSYPDGRTALKEVSFTVQPGEAVGVLGANGAGKTTLFFLLAGVLKASSGRVSVAGLNPFDGNDRRLLPRKLGIVFQNSDDQIFHSSVGEDVAFGPLNLGIAEDEVRSRVAASLEQVGLRGAEERSPLRISGGEKRKVALAGILAMQAEVVLFDEPTVFLDARGRRSLAGTVASLQQTRLIASHDLDFVRETCKRVLLLAEGRLVGEGPTEEVLADRETLSRHGIL